ncbi:hypothetical protein GCM10010174_52390 [Kutzneria viridogrisea]|uniref:MarR family transcriptional regulator n=1 Tax=Kutzneria viridogrisea TaxID=47990 RepID=A0ABR6BJ51_9PSEU|nr:hypothetical protein [Kutzneria viridogrisea]
MSSKTRTRKPRTTATTATTTRALRSVPDQPAAATVRTDTEDKLWEALHANPNSTAADLSAAARIGKSTAQKILVKWEGDGSVTRTAGNAEGGRRAADLWAITETTDGTSDNDTDTTTDDTPAGEGTVDDTAPAQTMQDEPTIDPEPTDTTDATSTGENLSESASAESPDPAPVGAQDTTYTTTDAVPEDTQDTTADTVHEETEPADAEPASTEATGPADGSTTPEDATETASDHGKSHRLAPGGLRGMVEDWLRDHPDEQAGPTKIANDLGGKSSGAVSNALDKLVEGGVAVKTQDKPKRFALAPAEQTASAVPAN